MSLGMHFAINKTDQKKLLAMDDEESRIEYVTEVIEERDDEWAFETDKAWDAIDKCLTSTEPEARDMKTDGPLAFVIFGGESLCVSDDYWICLKTPEQVQAIAQHMGTVTEAELRAKYRAIPPEGYDGELNSEDEDYTWSNFVDLAGFYKKAAAAKRSMLFTVG